MNNICYIGDTHIGKRFKTGVPLNRLGEREELIYKLFEEQLNQEADAIIHLGDLFDTPTVSYDDLMRTFKIIRKAAKRHPLCQYIFLAGNHDISKDTEKTCAFKVLSYLLNMQSNVTFVYGEAIYIYKLSMEVWPYMSYDRMRECLSGNRPTVADICCGHFDEPFPSDIFDRFKEVHTGHIHVPNQVRNVTVHGSIIPMNFGEDPQGDLYRTVTLEQFEEIINNPLDDYWQDYCYRVILKEGEVLPEGVNCRQLISIRDDVINAPEFTEEVTFSESLDMEKLFHEALDETGLFDRIYERYLQLKLEQKD